ncbi:hypothetical protein ACFTAO_29820 [Paenibacillus rhizoplanae]
MWLQYYKLVREDLNDMEQSAAAGDLKGLDSGAGKTSEPVCEYPACGDHLPAC